MYDARFVYLSFFLLFTFLYHLPSLRERSAISLLVLRVRASFHYFTAMRDSATRAFSVARFSDARLSDARFSDARS
jgi:hypothetical protein